MLIERTIEIAARPADLWILLTDGEQMKRWMADLVHSEGNGPLEVGASSKVTVREGSREVEYLSTVKECQPHELLEIELSGGSLGQNPMRVRYELSGATSLRYEAEWKPKEIHLKLMAPLISGMARKNADKALDALKAVAEE